MKKLILVFFLFSFLPIFSQSFYEYELPNDKSFYELRMDVYNDDDYSPYWSYPERDDIFALVETDPKEFVEKAEEWLVKFPIDINMLYVLSFTYQRLENYHMYAKRFYQYLGLISSILTTGDGKSMETGFEVISTSEEYSILNELNLEFVSQALVSGCDAMTCTDHSGNSVVIYFKVHKLFQKMHEKREK